jgi:ankyrin repeat protein
LKHLCSNLNSSNIVNTVDFEGRTPLYYASSKGYFFAVKSLLDSGANVHIRTFDGSTVLGVACVNGHFEIAQLLSISGANFDRLDTKVVQDFSRLSLILAFMLS